MNKEIKKRKNNNKNKLLKQKENDEIFWKLLISVLLAVCSWFRFGKR